MAAPVRAADEEELRVRTRVALLEQPRLDLVREAARRRGRRGPRGHGTRPGSSGRRGWRWRRATRRSRARPRRRTPPTLGHPTPARARPRRSPGPFRPARPACTDSSETTPSRSACTSFSIFIASTTQITWPAATASPSRDLDREHRALHRADDRVAPAGAARSSSGALAPPLGERGPGRLGDEHLDVEPAAVELDSRHALPEPAVRPCRYLCCRMRQLAARSRCAQLLRLDHAVARAAVDEARVAEQRAVEAEQRRHAADLDTRRAPAASAAARARGRRRGRSASRSSGRRAARSRSRPPRPESTRTPGPPGSR